MVWARRVIAVVTVTQLLILKDWAVPDSEAELDAFERLQGDWCDSMALVGGE